MKKSNLFFAICLILVVGLFSFLSVGCAPEEEVVDEPVDEEPVDEPEEPEEEPLRIAVVLYGTADDYAWNAGMINSVQRIVDSGDYNIEVDFVENAYGQGEAIMRDYIERGYGFIIAQGSGFIDDVNRMAEENPEVYFLSGMEEEYRAPNIANFMAHYHEGGFLAGALAGLMSENGYVASVGGMAHPTTIAACESFLDGARYVDPDIEVGVIYAGDYEDPGAGGDAATALMEDGADIINNVGNGTGLGVVSAVVDHDKLFTGFFDTQYPLAAENHLVSVANVWDGTVRSCIEMIINDAWEDGPQFYENLEGGGLQLTPWEHSAVEIPQEYIDQIEEIKQGIIDGTIEVDTRLETYY